MKRSLFYVFVAGLQSIGSIGGPLIAARRLGPAQLGVLAIGVLVVVFVRSLASLGLYGPVSVALHDGPEGVRRGRAILRWSGLLCLPIGAVLCVLGLVVQGTPGSFLSSAAAGCAGAVAMGHQALHRSVTDHAAYASAVLGPTAYANLAGLAALWTLGGGAATYLAGMAVVSLLVSLMLHLRHVHGVAPASGPERKAALRVGLPLVLTAAATVGLSLGDRPIIGGILGEAEVGRYHLTYIIAGGGVPLLAALNNAWLPMVLDTPAAERMRILACSLAGLVVGTTVMSLGAAAAAPAVVKIVGGAQYVDSSTVWVAGVIALGVVPYAVYSGMTIGLLSLERTSTIAKATVLAVLANLAANLALVPTVGLVGAAASTIVSYGVAAGVAWRAIGGRSTVAWATPKVALAMGGLCLGILLLAQMPVDGPEALTVRILIGAVAGALGCRSVAKALSRRPAANPEGSAP